MAGVIPDEVVARVIASNDIVEVIGSYLPLKQAGRYYKALCPFHAEKTPSFVVNPERQIFHCFGCGEGGDVISFLMKQERFSFPEAVRYLAQQAGIPISTRAMGREEDGRLQLYEIHKVACEYYRRNLLSDAGRRARDYLRARGIGEEAEARFLLGYALSSWEGLLRLLAQRHFSPAFVEQAGLAIHRSEREGYYDRFRDRLMIPIWDVAGKVVGFGARALDGSEPKYLNSPDTPIYRKGAHLYGLNLAASPIRERGFAIVVEGYFDLIALHLHGFDNTVAVLGTALTGEQARLLHRYAKKVILVFDPDAPGWSAGARGAGSLLSNILEPAGLFHGSLEWLVAVLPEEKDPDAFIREYGTKAFADQLAKARDLIEFLWDRRASGFDMRNPGDQVKGLKEVLLPMLATINDPVIRAQHTQKLLQRVGLSNVAVVEELNRLLAQGRRVLEGVYSTPRAPASAERTLIHIALHDPSVRGRILESLEVDDFSDPILKRVFIAQGEGKLVVSQQDPEVQRVLTELLASDLAAYEGALEQTVSDCIRHLRMRRERWRREELRRQLAEAQRLGDERAQARLKASHPEWRRAIESSTERE